MFAYDMLDVCACVWVTVNDTCTSGLLLADSVAVQAHMVLSLTY